MTTEAGAGGQGAGDTSKGAADKAAADKTAADKGAADKAAADKGAADQAAADKAAADAAAAAEAGGHGAGDTKAAAGESKAPETYELTLPAARFDAEERAAIETLARAQGWTNEEAQARVDAQAAAIDAQAAHFAALAKADPIYGGAHWDETQVHVARALDHFDPATTPEGAEFRRLLEKTGYGNHPAVLRHLAKVGKAMAEDGTVGGTSGGAPEEKTRAQRFYPNMPA